METKKWVKRKAVPKGNVDKSELLEDVIDDLFKLKDENKKLRKECKTWKEMYLELSNT
jgi:cell division septum initiation protein DivIVA